MRVVSRTIHAACAAFALSSGFAGAAMAQAGEAEAFYKGKNVDLIIASEAGGGYDLYARLVGPFLEKHLPGNPRFVPKQMIGAGGIERIVEIELNAAEKSAFDKSCAAVQELIEASRKLVG